MSDLFTESRDFAPASSTVQRETQQNSAAVSIPPKKEILVKNWRNYDYTNENGMKIFQKSVATKENGDKFAVWKRPENGAWVNGLGGAKPPLFSCYNLKHDKIYIVEGEKDVRTMAKLGFPAVCSPHGSKWSDEFAPQFQGKEVVVITDNDDPGRKYGADIERSLQGIAMSVKIIPAETMSPLPLEKGGDISDIAEVFGHDETVRLLNCAENPDIALDFNEIDMNPDEPEYDMYDYPVEDCYEYH